MALRILLPTAATLLLLALLSSPPTATADSDDKVLDINGNQLQFSHKYYLVPHLRTAGGGVTMEHTGGGFCPSGYKVTQSSDYNNYGAPIYMSPTHKSKSSALRGGFITNSSQLKIQYSYLDPAPLCRRFYPTTWSVSPNADSGEMLVELGDASTFTILKSESGCGGYGIKHIGSSNDDEYVTIIDKGNGKRMLGVGTVNPFLVTFVPVNTWPFISSQ